jgi:hypothetical protein
MLLICLLLAPGIAYGKTKHKSKTKKESIRIRPRVLVVKALGTHQDLAINPKVGIRIAPSDFLVSYCPTDGGKQN